MESMSAPDRRGARRRLNVVLLLSLVVGLPLVLYLVHRATDERTMTAERLRMVDEQIAARGIRDDRILEAMRRVPRHLFVGDLLRPAAYADRPLPIGRGQTISQPYIVALMTEVLQPTPGMKILEIGTGSGYQAAVLAELGCRVWSMELIPELARFGESNLRRSGYASVQVRCGNGFLGWPDEAPFDAVIVTCAPEAIPKALVEQLRDGGRMVIPVGSQQDGQSLTLVRKTGSTVVTDEIIPVLFVPMVDAIRNEGS